MNKPICDPGDFGENVFLIIGRVIKTLRRNGMGEKVDEFKERANSAESYEQVWNIAEEYVEFE